MAAISLKAAQEKLLGASINDLQARIIGELIAGGVLPDTGNAYGGTGQDAVTAAGSNINDAFQLTAQHANVTVVGSGTGVKLFDFPVGTTCAVRNSDASDALLVYAPNGTAQINAISAGTGASIAATEVGYFTKISANLWICGVGVIP